MSRIRTKTGGIPYARYQLQRAILEGVLEDNYSEEEYKAALRFFGGCAFCGAQPAPRMDHLIPVRNAGDFVRNNVVPACQQCDDSKGQKEYHEWMRNSTSPKSLRSRGMAEDEIERRIRRIETWQAGYKSKTEEQLFGQNYRKYLNILQKMDALCEEARQLVYNIKSQSSNAIETPLTSPMVTKQIGTTADRIRQYVLDNYFKPGRERHENTVIVRSGDVHSCMQLHQQHANVCQTLKGDKLQHMAGVKLLSMNGPKAGGNTYFKYQL